MTTSRKRRTAFCAISAYLALWWMCFLPPSPTWAQNATLPQFTKLMTRFQSEVNAGNSAEAIELAKQLIDTGEGLLGKSNPDVIRFGITRAVLLRNQGEYKEARAQLDTTIVKAKMHLGERHPVTATALSTLGTIYQLQADFPAAKESYRQAITILKGHGEKAAADRAEVYANYSELLSVTGDPAGARKYLEDALSINLKKWGRRHPRTAVCLNNLGLLLLSLGDNLAAEKRLRESLVLHQIIHGKEHPEVVSSWSNLGKLLVARGQYQEAAEAYEIAIKMAQETLPERHPTTLSIQNNLGQLYAEQGNGEKALPLLQDTLAQQLEVLGTDHPSTAVTRHNLGALFVDKKQPSRARTLLLESATYFEQKDVGRGADAAGSRAYLAIAEANAERVAVAIEQFAISRKQATRAAWRTLAKLSNFQQADFMRSKFNWTLFASLSLAIHNPENQFVLDATAEWVTNGKGIATDALARSRAGHNTPEPPWVSLATLRAAIPENAAWIDIIRQDHIDYSATSYQERLKSPRYVAWVVTPHEPVRRVELGDAMEIEQLVRAACDLIGQSGGVDGRVAAQGEVEATANVRMRLQAVADRVWKPISNCLPDGTKRLLISPDGELWLLPWAAIPQDSDTFLIEKFAISTYASGRMLCRAAPQQPSKRSNSAVFSNPDFDQNAVRKRAAFQAVFDQPPGTPSSVRSFVGIDRKTLSAVPLPGTEMEAAAVSPSMTRWLQGREPLHYKGSYAMESIAKRLTSPRSVLFATHGFYSEAMVKTAFDPLTRCGLLLSGCNDPQSQMADDDGILTGAEITMMNLQGTELVVLSACETGVGRIENGNGVVGLRAAFHLAGAESVISTLWQIPDFDSAKLMADFFSHVADLDFKDQALRAAQLKRIESRRKRNGAAHPFFWAGYSLSGQ